MTRSLTMPPRCVADALRAAVLVAAAACAAPSAAQVAPFNNSGSFATATAIGPNGPSMTFITLSSGNIGVSTSTSTDTNGDVATADLSGALHPGELTLDLRAVDVTGNVYAMAEFADGFTVTGAAAPIPVSVSVAGTSTLPIVDNEIHVYAYTYAQLASAGYVNFVTTPVAEMDIYDERSLNQLYYRACTPACPIAFSPFPGSANLNFNLNPTDGGLVLVADALSTAGVVDFTGSITTTFAPPPGTTLTLAAAPVPEPGTLCLLGFTLAGFGLKRRLHRGGRGSTAARGVR